LKFYFFYDTVGGNPGYITGSIIDSSNIRRHLNDGLTEERFCVTCLIPKPPRSKHCKICGKCVSRFDHHCPWVANCVAQRNHLSFVMWLLTLTICNGICLVLCYYFWATNPILAWKTDIGYWGMFLEAVNTQPYGVAVTFFNILHFPWFFMLLSSQVYLVSIGMTTNETINWHRYSYLKSADGKQGHRSNIYDLGIFRNWLQFLNLGPKVDWTNPYLGAPPHIQSVNKDV